MTAVLNATSRSGITMRFFFFIIIMGLNLMEGTAVFDSLCFLCLSGHNVISLSIYIFSNIYANVFRFFAYFNVDCPDK